MVLHVQLDASHLWLQKAGSVAGSYHHLGDRDTPFALNGVIIALCRRIPTVCVAASESESALPYMNGQKAYFKRVIQAALHYS